MQQSRRLNIGLADNNPLTGGNEGLTATVDPAMTIAVVGTEGLSTPETQQQGKAPAAPLGAAAGATTKNTIPPER